jgi:hypothetical protein
VYKGFFSGGRELNCVNASSLDSVSHEGSFKDAEIALTSCSSNDDIAAWDKLTDSSDVDP